MGDPSTEISDDPVLASYQLVSLAPLATLDSFRLLRAAGPNERLIELDTMLDDIEVLQRYRLDDGGREVPGDAM